MLIYPPPLRPGSTIGVTAPSSGVAPRCHARLDACLLHLRDSGFRVKEGKCLRLDVKDVSGSAAERVEELHGLWRDPDVHLILPPWGGERACELLESLDFEMFRAKPKWIQGFSDVSTLLLPITLLSDVATAHGTNLMDTSAAQSDPLTAHHLSRLAVEAGGSFTQDSSHRWQKSWADYAQQPLAAYNLTEPTRWRTLGVERAVTFSGRLIGGCLDIAPHLAGTRFGDVASFAHRHGQTGTIIYLENADANPNGVFRSLWTLRQAGWFQGANGILLGRSAGPTAEGPDKYQLEEAYADALASLDIPVVFDVDTGHVVPQMTLINGAQAVVQYSDGKGKVTQTLV